MSDVAIIVLAAGQGTRMKSRLPKVLHQVAGRSMLGHVLALARQMDPARLVVVHGPGEEGAAVAAEARTQAPDVALAEQAERLGTGHAVMQAMDALEGFSGTVLVLYGDVPLLRRKVLQGLLAMVDAKQPIAVLGFEAAEPGKYGRLLTAPGGAGLEAIVEAEDATEEQLRITLCNSGVMAIDAALLRRLLSRLSNDNKQGEYYLTDLVALARGEKLSVGLVLCDEEDVLGVNDRVQLAEAERVMQRRLRERVMREGATLIDPDSVFLSTDAEIGQDVVIGPFVVIGSGVRIADEVVIHSHCHLEGAVVERGAQVGPFARLRPGAVIEAGAKIGNFVEIKNATVETGAKVNHLSYIGDARVGADANIGAGTITCNYDGYLKHHTDIGKGAFIGSNSALVAPVKVGEGAYIGSGSVITDDVPPGALALARGRQVEKPDWAQRFHEAMRARLAKARKAEK